MNVRKGMKNVLGLFVVFACICMLDVSEISASLTDADYYAKVLKNQQFIADADGNMDLGTDFILYDINKDGHKELIVNGFVGDRGEDVSIVYSPKKDKYVKMLREKRAVLREGTEGLSLYDENGNVFVNALTFGKDGVIINDSM